MGTPQGVWNNCLQIIRDNITEETYNALFGKLVPIRLDGETLVLQTPSYFVYEYIEEHYLDLMRKTIRRELGNNAKLEWSIMMAGTASKPIPQQETTVPTNRPISLLPVSGKFNPFVMPGLQELEVDPQLNPRYAFENYIEGACNRVGRSAGLSIAKDPGNTAFNPLFVYGSTGLGKTHLAQAIGLEIKKMHPERVVLYLTAHKFQEQYVSAFQKKEINDFLNFYQMIDVLILDDVHDFAGKKGTQETFFHVFDHLYRSKKQLILTSDKPPVDIEGFEPRILSRFKWGLTAELTVPEYETRLKILQHKIYKDGLDLNDDIVEYLAAKITNNIRELEGVLNSLLAESTFNRKAISMEMAVDVVNKNIKNTKKEFTPDYIYKAVCTYFNVPLDNAQSKTRKREIVQARQIAMYFSKTLTKNSLASIGTQIGGKNHATVLHACKTVNNLMDTDKVFADMVGNIEKKIRAM